MRFPPELQEYVDGEAWRHAKTMPKWPHEYLVRGKTSSHERYQELVAHIRKYGWWGHFYRMRMQYYEQDGMYYWTSCEPGSDVNPPVVINRCSEETSFDYREWAGQLPK